MAEKLQFVQVSPEQVQDAIIGGVKLQFDDLKKHFQPKEPTEFLTRQEVAKMLKVDISTIHNWSKRGILKPVGIGARVYFRREDLNNSIVELKKQQDEK
jgi:hypothetical protein